LADLADETFIDFQRGWGNRTLADRVSLGAGIVRNIPLEAGDQATALGLVRNRLGVTLLPRIGTEEEEDVSVIDLEDADLDLPVAPAAPDDRPPSAAAAALIDSILHAVGRRTNHVALRSSPDPCPRRATGESARG
jgi:DNA-binding transcriptional LysR family regulator